MLLIRDASLLDRGCIDVRILDGRIVEMAERLPKGEDAHVIDAGGGLLLPGLHDHHVHVAATAAGLASVPCGPPQVHDAQDLVARLSGPGEGWLRGTGYHESVAGMLDRAWLDEVAPHRPVRIQHRSGRMWFLNTPALELLQGSGLASPSGLDVATGQLFDADAWMRQALGGAPPAFDAVGRQWARWGVTGLTEMSPANDDRMADHFARERGRGALPQRVLLAGRSDLGAGGWPASLTLGPVKLHLHEADLPDFDDAVVMIDKAHASDRTVAVHCVSEVELVFTLAAFAAAGVRPGDRIEHASVCPDALLDDLAQLGLAVVAQPNFVAERGDAYRSAIPETEWPALYRLQSFRTAGVPLAGGTDTPFGDSDPWKAMAAAVSRKTPCGEILGAQEALSPEQALGLFLADPLDLGVMRRIEQGGAADLCLLSAPWSQARQALSADLVRATIIEGRVVHDRVDQAPGQGRLRADPLA